MDKYVQGITMQNEKINESKNKIKSKFKMIVFDVDGTLLLGESGWETLHKKIGTIESRNEHQKMFREKKINIMEWVKKDIEIWIKKGITIDEINNIISKKRTIKNIEKVLKILKDNGFIIAIVSGGLDIYFDTVLKDVKKYFDYIFINKLIVKNNKIVDINPTIFDFDNKIDAVKKICDEKKISLDEVIFVGDGINDIKVMKECGFGIALNPKDDLGNSPDVIINTDDLMDIIKYVK